MKYFRAILHSFIKFLPSGSKPAVNGNYLEKRERFRKLK